MSLAFILFWCVFVRELSIFGKKRKKSKVEVDVDKKGRSKHSPKKIIKSRKTRRMASTEALFRAINKGDSRAVSKLLKQGTSARICSASGHSPLDMAAAAGNDDCVVVLVRKNEISSIDVVVVLFLSTLRRSLFLILVPTPCPLFPKQKKTLTHHSRPRPSSRTAPRPPPPPSPAPSSEARPASPRPCCLRGPTPACASPAPAGRRSTGRRSRATPSSATRC